MRNAKYGMRSTECEVRNEKYGMRSTECEVRITKYKLPYPLKPGGWIGSISILFRSPLRARHNKAPPAALGVGVRLATTLLVGSSVSLQPVKLVYNLRRPQPAGRPEIVKHGDFRFSLPLM